MVPLLYLPIGRSRSPPCPLHISIPRQSAAFLFTRGATRSGPPSYETTSAALMLLLYKRCADAALTTSYNTSAALTQDLTQSAALMLR